MPAVDSDRIVPEGTLVVERWTTTCARCGTVWGREESCPICKIQFQHVAIGYYDIHSEEWWKEWADRVHSDLHFLGGVALFKGGWKRVPYSRLGG